MLFQKDSRIKNKNITYNIKKNKYVVCKDGVYFSLTFEQVKELNSITNNIITGKCQC